MSPENNPNFQVTEESVMKMFEGQSWADGGAPPAEATVREDDSSHNLVVKTVKRELDKAGSIEDQLAVMASILLEMTDYHPNPDVLNGKVIQADGAWAFGQNTLYRRYTPPMHILYAVSYLCWIRKFLIESNQ